MPIETTVPIRKFDQESFHQVDMKVTGLAFDIHNEFGRYLDESVYKGELTRRCRDIGFDIEPEMEIAVRLGDFKKLYFADHLIDRGVIIEVKTASALGPAHKGQTLNYLYLCDLRHGTLLNFRSERVEHQFVSTQLTLEERYRYSLRMNSWKQLTPRCRELPNLLHQLLAEWGAFLDPILYRDGLTHFLGGDQQVVCEIPVISGGIVIGVQEVRLMAEDIAFSVTASTHRPITVLEHQRRFLRHTNLRAIHWVNFNHHRVELCTIER